MLRIGLIGFGKAGQAVASVLREDPRFELCWIARRSPGTAASDIPGFRLAAETIDGWLAAHPVDAIVDFSAPESLLLYGEAIRRHGIRLVTAISNYPPSSIDYLHALGRDIPLLASPNITLGINFLMLAARLLQRIAPFADIEILEQHFREKPEVSGTARKLAETLDLQDEHITSMRLGGIVGHHEVIFGFPHQTVRLIHNSIRREAFGTGAAFALEQLAQLDKGFYTFEQILLQLMRDELQHDPQPIPSRAACRDSSSRPGRLPA